MSIEESTFKESDNGHNSNCSCGDDDDDERQQGYNQNVLQIDILYCTRGAF